MSAPGRIRTCDKRIRRPLLYPLSYWGTVAPTGRVVAHRDYWDAAEELYEKLPVLGALMRLLKRRLRAT